MCSFHSATTLLPFTSIQQLMLPSTLTDAFHRGVVAECRAKRRGQSRILYLFQFPCLPLLTEIRPPGYWRYQQILLPVMLLDFSERRHQRLGWKFDQAVHIDFSQYGRLMKPSVLKAALLFAPVNYYIVAGNKIITQNHFKTKHCWEILLFPIPISWSTCFLIFPKLLWP